MIDWISITPSWLHPFPDPYAMWMTGVWFVASFILAYLIGRIFAPAGVLVGAVLLGIGGWLMVLPWSLVIVGLLILLWMGFGYIVN